MSRNPYLRKVPKTTWWFQQARYQRYMLREVTCIFIGAYTAVLLMGLRALAAGPEPYQAFLEGLNSGVAIVFHLLVLAVTVYHSVSWFNVTPKAMPIQMGEDMLPGGVIIGVHYVGWVVISLAVLFLAGM